LLQRNLGYTTGSCNTCTPHDSHELQEFDATHTHTHTQTITHRHSHTQTLTHTYTHTPVFGAIHVIKNVQFICWCSPWHYRSPGTHPFDALLYYINHALCCIMYTNPHIHPITFVATHISWNDQQGTPALCVLKKHMQKGNGRQRLSEPLHEQRDRVDGSQHLITFAHLHLILSTSYREGFKPSCVQEKPPAPQKEHMPDVDGLCNLILCSVCSIRAYATLQTCKERQR